MIDVFKCLLYKKNTAGPGKITCFIIGAAIVLGLWSAGMHPDTGRMSGEDPVNELCTFGEYTASEIQAELRQIKGDFLEIFESCRNDNSFREESLKLPVYILELSFAGILLLLKRITTDIYRMQCYGNASILRYIHHKDGQK